MAPGFAVYAPAATSPAADASSGSVSRATRRVDPSGPGKPRNPGDRGRPAS